MRRCIVMAGGCATELPEVREELAVLMPGWDWVQVPDGLGALDVLTRRKCDAVVADLRLGDLTGLQLLHQVMEQWPRAHRVILADLGDVDTLLRCVGGAHQFLARPCEAQRLKAVLERAFVLDYWLPNEAVRTLLGRLPGLPSPASTYHGVVRMLEAGDMEGAGRLIAEDPPLAARVLQLANSAAYGPPLDESDVQEAVRQLGLANVRSMILLAHTAAGFRDGEPPMAYVEELWRHARRTARLARRLVEGMGGGPELIANAGAAGMLHDLGQFALAVNLPERHREARQLAAARGMRTWEAEQEVFGAHHGEVGGSLLGLWGLPMAVVEAVALHHHPTRLLTDGFGALAAVHVADAMVKAESLEAALSWMDMAYLENLGVDHLVRGWWEVRCELGSDEDGARR